MCLSTVYRGKQKKEALAKLPESGYYWKVVRRVNERYIPRFSSGPIFKDGINEEKATYCGTGYKTSFHLFANEDDAKCYGNESYVYVIRCKVNKSHIVTIGVQQYCGKPRITIVTTRFWCPKPK